MSLSRAQNIFMPASINSIVILDQYNENLKLQLQIKECYTPMYLAHNTSITPKLCYNLDLFSMNAVYI